MDNFHIKFKNHPAAALPKGLGNPGSILPVAGDSLNRCQVAGLLSLFHSPYALLFFFFWIKEEGSGKAKEKIKKTLATSLCLCLHSFP